MSAKSSRRSGKRQRQETVSSGPSSLVYDLMIPLPKESASIRTESLLQRLGATGVTHAALSHTVFGTPKAKQDEADKAIPESIWQGGKNLEEAKKRTREDTNDSQRSPPVKVLRRLTAVLENLSDLSHYTKRDNALTNSTSSIVPSDAVSKSWAILQEYDLVSLCPRNEPIFQSACKSATGSDIIVLDYTSGRGGVQLPYKIRPGDVKAAIARNAVFEIHYAPAILNRNQRKGLVQTCRALQLASLGLKPKVILSSGDRSVIEGEDDVGIMALRTPADLMNVMQVIMKFDSRLSYEALHTSNTFALDNAHSRRFGKKSITITGIAIMGGGVQESKAETAMLKGSTKISSKNAKASEEAPRQPKDVDGNDKPHAGDDGQDGFIAF